MAAASKNFWSTFFAFPDEGNSYFQYVLSLKFIWAPIVYIAVSIKDWLFNFFGKPSDNKTGALSTAMLEKEAISPTTNASLYNHARMNSDLLAAKETVDPDAILAEYETNSYSKDALGNTPLTGFLAIRTFNSLEDYRNLHQRTIKSVLTRLSELAKTSKSAQQLLITPNNPDIEENANTIRNGLPLNTPLMLLVKAGDYEAVKLVLPFYSAEDLMRTTPRGNSVFHIASITGQNEILIALKRRAEELNIWNVYKEHKNSKGYTAYQMLSELFSTKNLFQNIIDFSNQFLGGEEINKAAVSNNGENKVLVARKGGADFYYTLITESINDDNKIESNSSNLNVGFR